MRLASLPAPAQSPAGMELYVFSSGSLGGFPNGMRTQDKLFPSRVWPLPLREGRQILTSRKSCSFVSPCKSVGV